MRGYSNNYSVLHHFIVPMVAYLLSLVASYLAYSSPYCRDCVTERPCSHDTHCHSIVSTIGDYVGADQM